MKYTFVIVLVLSAALFSGCCKGFCVDESVALDFSNFKAVDTDTILFLGYKAGTNRQERTDSFYLYGTVSPADTTRSSVFYALPEGKDWKVIIPSPLQKTYIIDGFEQETARCNCGGDKYKTITSYRVNGEVQTDSHYFTR